MTKPAVQVVLALGGNFEKTGSLFKQACEELANSNLIFNLTCSALYKTPPLSPIPQAPFLNLCLLGLTSLAPLELFELTERVERRLGKVAKPKEAPRPIDIDILFYGTERVEREGLVIPHREWQRRLFVLYPLKDLFERAPTDGDLTLLERINGFSESEREGIISLGQFEMGRRT